MSRPSTVRVTTSGGASRCVSAKGAPAVFDVREVLVSEALDRRGDRRHGRRPEGTDRRLLRRPGDAGADVVAHVEQQIEVGLPPGAVLDAMEDLLEPAGAL